MSIPFIIITPTFNRSTLVTRAIDSVVAQNHSNWTLIVVNDGSTDDTDSTLLRYADNDQIEIINLPYNQGCNFARNLALDYIQSHDLQGFILFLDDDDYLTINILTLINNLLINNFDWKWVVSNCVYPDGELVSRISEYGRMSYLYDYMLGKRLRGDVTHFIHTSIVKSIRFSTEIKNGQEWYFFAPLSAYADIQAADLNAKIVEYLPGGLSQAKVNSENRLQVARMKIERLTPLVSKKLLCSQQLGLARELLRNGETTQAVSLLLDCFPFIPFSFRLYRYLFLGLIKQMYFRMIPK
jgi:glycosyltransferase involved in cell wall biosynthesis